jgi:hypothetical protein
VFESVKFERGRVQSDGEAGRRRGMMATRCHSEKRGAEGISPCAKLAVSAM